MTKHTSLKDAYLITQPKAEFVTVQMLLLIGGAECDGIGFVEFPFAKRIMLKRIRENYAKPSTIAFVMTEAALQGRPIEDALALEAQGDALGRGAANAAIPEHFPDFNQMLKIVVSPDADAIKADCVIRDFTEARKFI